MMRKNITRTLTKATIHAFKITVENGTPSVETLEPVVAWGRPSHKDAMKAVKAVYGEDATITIGEIELDNATYQISVEDFVANAHEVEPGTENDEEEEGNE